MKKYEKIKTKKHQVSKYQLIIFLVVLVAFLSLFFLKLNSLKKSLGAVYNVTELEQNFSKINVGDTIDYEINGYNDWQVISTDKDNGTIDIVAKTNTEGITMSHNNAENILDILQEAADKYTDNKYAVSARSINLSDRNNYTSSGDTYWYANKDDVYISTSNSSWRYNYLKKKMYVIPMVLLSNRAIGESYDEGEEFNYSFAGVDEWVVIACVYFDPQTGSGVYVTPKNPIELEYDADTDIHEKGQEIISRFSNEYGNGSNLVDNTSNHSKFYTYLKPFFDNQTEDIWFYNSNNNYAVIDMGDAKKIRFNGTSYGYVAGSNSISHYGYADIITGVKETTYGLRPVVTLKINSAKKGKELSDNNIKIGNNIKYEANGYKNWKVLSIDEEADTVDVISGGIVKNITYIGKDDYDNYETNLQQEVDNYKNDSSNVLDAKTVTAERKNQLIIMDDNVKADYWINKKKENNNNYFSLSTMYIDSNYNISVRDVTVCTISDFNKTEYGKATRETSYTAGLRPIITLKKEAVEVLPEEETEKIVDQSEKSEKQIIREQQEKNKDYNSQIKENNIDNSSTSKEKDSCCITKENKVYKEYNDTFIKVNLAILYVLVAIEFFIIIYLLYKTKKMK